MSLLLSQRTIGEGWEPMMPGDLAGRLSQWYDPMFKSWQPMGFALWGYPCRVSNLWRKPVGRLAKIAAIWAAKGKLFDHYILRKTT